MSKKKNQDETSVDLPKAVRILALETATNVSSVAVFENGKLLGLQENLGGRTHAKLITVMIDRLLKDLEILPKDLDAVAVAMGPGSYTGLRVGVSTAKGFCMALDLPLIGVENLHALANGMVDFAKVLEAKICAMIDARRMEVFCQLFDAESNPIHSPEAKVIEEGAFQKELDAGKVIFLGDGAEKCRGILEQHPNAVVLGSRISSAALLGEIAFARFQKGEFENLITFEPFYLKDFVATISKKKIL